MQDLMNIGLLFKHMEWADASVWKSVLLFPVSHNDSALKKYLFHIHSVQRAFYYIWTGQPLELPKETDFNELIDLAKWGGEYYKNLETFLKSFDRVGLNDIIEIPWANRLEKIIGKKPVNPTVAETMLQVAMHTTYHRGQLNKRLRELGGEPPLIDFIVWIWLGKPKAEWKI